MMSVAITTAYAALIVACCIVIGLAISTIAATAAMQVVGALVGLFF